MSSLSENLAKAEGYLAKVQETGVLNQIDGKSVRSCLTFAVQMEGRVVDTVESLADKETGELSDLQKAFRKHHGLQCGYCTPGILMSVEYFLEVNPKPNEEEIREMLSGHICRCTGYHHINNSIEASAKQCCKEEK